MPGWRWARAAPSASMTTCAPTIRTSTPPATVSSITTSCSTRTSGSHWRRRPTRADASPATTSAAARRPSPAYLGTAVVKVFDYTLSVTGLTERAAKASGKFGVDGEFVGAAVITAYDKAHYWPGAEQIRTKLVIDKRGRQNPGRPTGGQGRRQQTHRHHRHRHHRRADRRPTRPARPLLRAALLAGLRSGAGLCECGGEAGGEVTG